MTTYTKEELDDVLGKVLLCAVGGLSQRSEGHRPSEGRQSSRAAQPMNGFKVEHRKNIILLWPDWRHEPLFIDRDQEDASTGPVFASLTEHVESQ